MDEKVYTPEIVQDTPFPQGLPTVDNQSDSPTNGTYAPATTNLKSFPVKRIAVELLSTALNTRSKKILQEFTFAPSGSIQIGNFEEGIAGDLRLTPNGITARDIAGITTFDIDGTSGDAIFKGEIRADSIITGAVTVGNNSIIIDGENKTIIVNDGTNDRIGIGDI